MSQAININRMYIENPLIEHDSNEVKISSKFHINERVIELWFKVDDSLVNYDALQDVCFSSVIIPAMAIGGTLEVEAPVSKKLLRNSSTIQSILNKWYPKLHIVDIQATEIQRDEASTALKTGQFFSGGVDSFYTLLKNLREVDDLFFVSGFDVFLKEREVLEDSLRTVKSAAQKFNKNLIEIQTNLHDFSKEFTLWPNHYHGSAMAAMAMLVSNQYSNFLFASSHSYADMFPWGSHPLLDRLWSTEYLEIAHDGCEATRVEKTFYISKYPEVLEHLRVGCLETCRRTEKCLRTMIALDLAGVLADCKTFHHPLLVEDVEKMEITGKNALSFVMENYKELLNRNDKLELRRALRIAIQRYQNKEIAKSLQKNMSTFKYSEHADWLRAELASQGLWARMFASLRRH